MVQTPQLSAITKLLENLVMPNFPNITKFDVTVNNDNNLDPIPNVKVFLKEWDEDDENNIDWAIKEVLKYLSIKYHYIVFDLDK
jgi:hypothetical protein